MADYQWFDNYDSFLDFQLFIIIKNKTPGKSSQDRHLLGCFLLWKRDAIFVTALEFSQF